MQSFEEAWKGEIWPRIEKTWTSLAATAPVSQETGSVGGHYSPKKVTDALARTGELRNVTGNVTWIKP